jgi:hypothetical protein
MIFRAERGKPGTGENDETGKKGLTIWNTPLKMGIERV